MVFIGGVYRDEMKKHIKIEGVVSLSMPIFMERSAF